MSDPTTSSIQGLIKLRINLPAALSSDEVPISAYVSPIDDTTCLGCLETRLVVSMAKIDSLINSTWSGLAAANKTEECLRDLVRQSCEETLKVGSIGEGFQLTDVQFVENGGIEPEWRMATADEMSQLM